MWKDGFWRWILLAAIVLIGLTLRVHDVSRIFLWIDETDMFNEYVYSEHPMSLIQFARFTRDATTVAWGWPSLIWIVSRSFGATIEVARMPTVLFSASGVLLLFFLVYSISPPDLPKSRYWPALFAALFAAVSIVEMEYAQRTYPYGAAPCIAAVILLAHFQMRRATSRGWKYTPQLLRAVVLYTAVVSIAFCIHSSLALLPAVSVCFLGLSAARDLRRHSWPERWKVLRLALAAGAVLACAALLSGKNPKYGYRGYLAEYYGTPSLKSIPKLLLHAYDLLTYQLNVIYNPTLYWPGQWNGVLLLLVLLCMFGWFLAARGKFGPEIRHLSWLGAAAVAAPAVLSLLKVFPFGGVRQCLFLNPFLLTFTAFGFYALRVHPITRVLGIAIACGYLALWATNLPSFYARRQPVYSPSDLYRAWEENGKLPVYSMGSDREVRYQLRYHPEVPIASLPQQSKPPYLLVETHNWIGDNRWFKNFPEYLRKSESKAVTVKEIPAWHPESRWHSQCLYFPPNGLWIYKVTTQ